MAGGRPDQGVRSTKKAIDEGAGKSGSARPVPELKHPNEMWEKEK